MTENNNFYFTVHSFMTRDLGLRGSSLIVYAIIYAFSYDGKGTFYGSIDFLSEQAGIGSSTVRATLRSLLSGGFIQIARGQKHESKEYRINGDLLKFISLKKENPNRSGGLPSDAKRFATDREGAETEHTGAKIKQAGAETKEAGRQNQAAEPLKSSANNKHNNKDNNKHTFISYKGADARKEKKRKDFFEKENSVTAGGTSDLLRSAKALEKASNAKYCHFDPEEAFRLALERTEEAFREMNERIARDELQKNNSQGDD